MTLEKLFDISVKWHFREPSAWYSAWVFGANCIDVWMALSVVIGALVRVVICLCSDVVKLSLLVTVSVAMLVMVVL